MKDDEKVAEYFLRVDEIVNGMKGLGQEVNEFDVVTKVVRTLPSKFESKVSALEEKKHFDKLTLDSLQGILTAYEMRTSKNNSTGKETTFNTEKKEKIEVSESELTDSKESHFVRRFKKGSGKYKGKLPFKCFNCGKIGHFATKCPYDDQICDNETTEKKPKKKAFKPKWNFNFKKKKILFSKDESDIESEESSTDEVETLFMTEITQQNDSNTFDVEEGVVDL